MGWERNTYYPPLEFKFSAELEVGMTKKRTQRVPGTSPNLLEKFHGLTTLSKSSRETFCRCQHITGRNHTWASSSELFLSGSNHPRISLWGSGQLSDQCLQDRIATFPGEILGHLLPPITLLQSSEYFTQILSSPASLLATHESHHQDQPSRDRSYSVTNPSTGCFHEYLK